MPNRKTETPLRPSVFAIVPAAGRARRMGRPKQLIEIDGVPMLLGVVEQLAASAIFGIMIVTRREIEDALRSHSRGGPRLEAMSGRVSFVYSESAQTEMIDSVRIGLSAWEHRTRIVPQDGYLVCPADHASIRTLDFDECLAAYRADSHRIVIASRHGRRGHPIIFPADLADMVRSPLCDRGLNSLTRSRGELVYEAVCGSDGVLADIDTPDDLERL